MRNKNTLIMITIVITLCYFSILWADDTKPKEFEAVAGDGVVYLYWSPPKGQVTGYWVYRALPNGNYQRVNSASVERTFYEDRDVVNEQFYWYALTAILPEGNEGTPSKTIGVTPNPRSKPSSGY
jgi:hypothetical protein